MSLNTFHIIKWKLIEADPDDDKYVDCAISGGLTTSYQKTSTLRY